jgi:Tol biopolymer transport system component
MSDVKNWISDAYSRTVYAWFPDGTVRCMAPGEGLYVTPCIHPDGHQAVFYGGLEGPPRIWQCDFQSQTSRPLTSPEVGCLYPSYSWDGAQIVYSSDAGFDQPREDMVAIAAGWRTRTYVNRAALNLFVMDSDGGDVRQITSGRHQDIRPSFSPDGGTVVFYSDRSGTFLLWTVPAGGGEEPTLLEPGVPGFRPWFSADGAWIFFHIGGEERHRICKMPSKGGEWEPLPNENLGRSHGAFADHDGEHLWFHSTVDGELSIYRLPLRGGEPVKMNPPGFEDLAPGHVTRARNGTMTFDASYRIPLAKVETLRKGS